MKASVCSLSILFHKMSNRFRGGFPPFNSEKKKNPI